MDLLNQLFVGPLVLVASFLVASFALEEAHRVESPTQEAADTIRVSQYVVDNRRVVYAANPRGLLETEVFSLDRTRHGETIRLSEHIVDSSVGGVRISSNARRVAYTVTPEGSDTKEVYGIDRDGPPIRLELPRAAKEDEPIQLAPDGKHILFFEQEDDPERISMWSVPTDGSASPVRLNGAESLFATNIWIGIYDPEAMISPDGQRVVYRAHDANQELQLYSVRIDGSEPPIRLTTEGVFVFFDWNIGFVGVGLGCRPQFTPDSKTLLYLADPDGDGGEWRALHNVPVDGSAPPIRLFDARPPGTDIGPYHLAPDGKRVVYFEGPYPFGPTEFVIEDAAFVTPIDGSVPPRSITDPYKLSSSFILFSPDSRYVLLEAYVDEELSDSEVITARMDGSKEPVPLITPDDRPSVFAPQISREGFILYINTFLYVVPVDGSEPARRLFGLPGNKGDDHVTSFELTRDGKYAVYRNEPEKKGEADIFMIDIHGFEEPLRLTESENTPYSIESFCLTPDERHVVFQLGANTFRGFDSAPMPERGKAARRVSDRSIP